MKKIIFSAFVTLTMNSFGQTENKIDSLSYAKMKIAVPENCQTKSEYELLECDGISIQWLYLNEEMLKTVPDQFMEQFTNQKTTKKKKEIKVESFGSELTGYKFTMKNQGETSYRIIVYGSVNNQPLLLNLGTETNIETTEDLNDFLKEIIEIK
ncbi:hypothetical protein U3A58_04740 [Algoriphagus sp. C2-6-M1]|uniref:hypothetical protein n=1 Tax=Algoriphagus persicinus TaxID=3108754 RepID=UPI002B379CA5|nr:hypothetical protein [Algoriphagus sp. C2-6-M1]MEB2779692.1 hypothetical protein [Algoriphagus sp. C2-6-M1]